MGAQPPKQLTHHSGADRELWHCREEDGKELQGKEGGEDVFKWVHHHRVWHAEEPCPGLQNALLYKGSLGGRLILDFCGALKSDGSWPVSFVGVFLS